MQQVINDAIYYLQCEGYNDEANAVAELEAENAELRKLIAQCATDFEAAADGSGVNFYQCAVDLRAALEVTK